MIKASRARLSGLVVFVFLLFLFFGFDMFSRVEATKHLISKDIRSFKSNSIIIHLEPENVDAVRTDKFFLNGILKLNYTRNFDIGFSLFTNLHLLQNLSKAQLSKVVLLVQVVSLLIILFFFIRNNLGYFGPFLFILSGGFGNIYERAFSGYVTDFISIDLIFLKEIYVWPIFNIGDVYVTFGACLFLMGLFKENKRAKKMRLEK